MSGENLLVILVVGLIAGWCVGDVISVPADLGATTHPTAEWIAQQLTEACGWDEAPRYLVRDRDQSYGEVFVRRVRAMGSGDDCNHRAANCPAASAARAGASVFGGVGHGIKSTSHAPREGEERFSRAGQPRAGWEPDRANRTSLRDAAAGRGAGLIEQKGGSSNADTLSNRPT